MGGAFTRGAVVPGFLDANEWAACFGLSWQDLAIYDMTHSRRVMRDEGTYLRKVAGAGGIGDGRNEVCASFLDDTDGEWLWFVDTDMGFAPDTVDNLVAAASLERRPVVGALCFALHPLADAPFHSVRNGTIPAIYDWDESLQGLRPDLGYGRDQVIQCAGTGAACLLIHRAALDTIRVAAGDAWFDPIPSPRGGFLSEDLSFCRRLTQAGIPIHVDTRVKTVHYKGGIFLDEDLYLAQQGVA